MIISQQKVHDDRGRLKEVEQIQKDFFIDKRSRSIDCYCEMSQKKKAFSECVKEIGQALPTSKRIGSSLRPRTVLQRRESVT